MNPRSSINPVTAFLTFVCILAGVAAGYRVSYALAAAFILVGVIVAMSLKMANAWQTFVILRMGKLQSVKGAGLFVIIPTSRQRGRGDRRTNPDDRLQCRAGAHPGHRPGQCRCNHLLACARCGEGCTGNHQLPRGHRPCRTDFVARDDRLVHARRAAVRSQGRGRAV